MYRYLCNNNNRYNNTTGESTFDKPAELVQAEAESAAAAAEAVAANDVYASDYEGQEGYGSDYAGASHEVTEWQELHDEESGW